MPVVPASGRDPFAALWGAGWHTQSDAAVPSEPRATLLAGVRLADREDAMTPDEQAAVRERWQEAGDQVAAHDAAQQNRLRDQVGAAERAVLEVVGDSSEA